MNATSSSSYSKRRWKKMAICRVRLNPEQAVLSCCDAVQKGQVSGLNQCADALGTATTCPGGVGQAATSS